MDSLLSDTATTFEESFAMTCAEAIAEVLASQGPEVIFGYPGAHTVKLHAAICRQGHPRHILVRHEQAAAFAADGFARASGKVGVFLTTAGPGATNAVTGIAESFTNSVPTVHLCCQVDSRFIGRRLGAWHEGDIESIFKPVTKWNATASQATDVPPLVLRALRMAVSGRPGPTQVCIPRDLLGQTVPPLEVSSENETCRGPDADSVAEAARALGEAERPVIIVGGGAVCASDEVRELARRLGAGVSATCMGKGIFPEDDPLSLGASFSHAASIAFREADLCLAVGCRFTQVGTGNWQLRVPENLIHIDVDASVIGLHYPARIAVLGDARQALKAIMEEMRIGSQVKRDAWRRCIEELRNEDRSDPSLEARLCRTLRRAIPRHAVVVGDVATLVYHMFRHFEAYEPCSLLYPAGYIAMGYGLPAAMGAQLAKPEALVVCIAGDGSFSMTGMELATIVQDDLPVKTIILNNKSLAAIAHFCRVEGDDLSGIVELSNPDFVALAKAFGLTAKRAPATDEQRIVDALHWLVACDGAALLEIEFAAGDPCT